MPRKLKIPPRYYPLKADGSAYVVVKWDDFFDVVYYRAFRPGEDGVIAEDAGKIHKRFADTKAKLIDALRVVFALDDSAESDSWDADMVEMMIRNDPRVPKFPGSAYKEYKEEDSEPKEEVHEWVPIKTDEHGRVILDTDEKEQMTLGTSSEVSPSNPS